MIDLARELDAWWSTVEPTFTKSVAAEVVAQMTARNSDALVPLEAIVGGSPAAARMRRRRDKELRDIGVLVGRRVLYSRPQVEALLAKRTQLRAVK